MFVNKFSLHIIDFQDELCVFFYQEYVRWSISFHLEFLFSRVCILGFLLIPYAFFCIIWMKGQEVKVFEFKPLQNFSMLSKTMKSTMITWFPSFCFVLFWNPIYKQVIDLTPSAMSTWYWTDFQSYGNDNKIRICD